MNHTAITPSWDGLNIGLVGAGRLGASLVAALAAGGLRVVAVGSRNEAAAASAGARGALGSTSLQAVADHSDVVFITTLDAAIAPVAAGLRWRPGQLVLHCSGALSLDALSAAAEQGAATGCFYPLQTFAAGAGAGAWDGITVALEGEPSVLAFLSGLARRLGGKPIVLASGQKALFHAAAVFASNYTVTLIAGAADLWQRLGFDRDQALSGLLPILRGTVGNLERLGLPGALTGPIVRGDRATIERHL
ncbi:MAG: DUF2520 domain-containing protein, partial [Chloroflexota bacterium]